MGLLVDGKWQDKWYSTAETGGKFVRKESQFRNWVTPTARPARAASAASRPSPAATTSTSPMPARGRTAR